MADKKTPEQKELDKAFKLLDAYNNPATTDDMKDKVVEKLFAMGYVIRPLQAFIMKDEVEAEIHNAGSKEWGLVDRMARKPIEREAQS